MSEIEELQELIDDFIDVLRELRSFFDFGATLQQYCDNRRELISEFNYLLKRVSDYVIQEDLKRLDELESEI